MSVIVSQLVAQVSVSGASEAEGQLARMAGTTEGLGGTLASLATGGAVLAAGALVGIGASAIHMAGDFQSGMTSLVTGAGEMRSNIGMVSDGILKMAVDTGTSSSALTAGMFMIESAGFHGAQGLQVLQTAAEGAKVGNADLATTSMAMISVMKDYHLQAGQSADAMNFLTGIVQNGTTTMQDLAGSVHNILPTAAALGVNLRDVGGAMATMTGETVPAADAATYLRQMLMSLAAPAAGGQKALLAIGLSAGQVSTDMKKSLPDTLQLIMTHLAETYKVGSPQYVTALKNIAGGSKQMQGFLDLTGSHLKDFGQNVKNVTDVMNKGKGGVVGWADVQKDFNQQIAHAKEVVETLMIRIGTALLPTIQKIMGAVMPVISGFEDWITSGNHLQTALSTVGNVIKQVGTFVLQNLVMPIAHLAEAIGNVIIPIGEWLVKSGVLHGVLVTVGTVIGIIAVGVGKLIDGLASVVNFFAKNQAAATALLIPLGMLSAVLVQMAVTSLVAFIASIPALVGGFIAWAGAASAAAIATIAATWPILAIGAVIGAVVIGIIEAVKHWGAISAWLKQAWANVIGWLGGAMNSIGTFFVHVWNGIKNFFVGIWTGIVSFLKAHALLLLAVITGPIGAIVILIVTHFTQIKQFISNIWNDIKGAFSAAFNWIKGIATTFWNAEVNAWNSFWGKVKGIATSLWNDVKGAFNAAFNWIKGLATTFWDNQVKGWNVIWNKVKSIVTGLWNDVVNLFNNAWNNLLLPLGRMENNIIGWFKGLTGKAIQWGKDLIQNLISGITGMVGSLGHTVQNIAGTIAKFLHFTKPDAGPLVDVDKWMPDMVNILSTGLTSQIPKMQSAVAALAAPLALSLNPSTPGFAGASGLRFPSVAAAGSGGQTIIHNHSHLYIDGKELTNVLLEPMGDALARGSRLKHARRTF